MGPQTKNLDRTVFFKDLIDQAMLDVNASRVSPSEITDQPFKWRRRRPRILLNAV